MSAPILSRTIIYAARDIERAIGMEPSERYRIITNASPLATEIAAAYPAYITLIQSPEPLDTSALLSHPDAARAIADAGDAGILVFKTTPQIETICATRGWQLLNPPATLAEQIENKVTQVAWLGELASRYLPEHSILTMKDLRWAGKPFIVQWAHGHTGDGTILVSSEKELSTLVTTFPDRSARVSAVVQGPSFTVNVAVTPAHIIMGNPSYQITGLAPFTDNTFSTVGNDWSAVHGLLSESELAELEAIASAIGERMRASGWKGLFGIDAMRDDATGRIVLIEINARQPASTTFESMLQSDMRSNGVPGITLFEAHLLAFAGQDANLPPVPINDGAQIVQRRTRSISRISPTAIAALEHLGYIAISYDATALNADLLRIQSPQGIIETHGRLNTRGKEILDTLATS